MMNEILKDLKPDINGLGWLEGHFESKSFFKGNISITIFDNTDEAKDYAIKCIKHYNQLNDNKEIVNEIIDKLEKFMYYMYEEWKAMGIYDEIANNVENTIDDYKKEQNIFKYLTNPGLYIELPEDNEDEIGYVLTADCPWEPEHQCSIIIRNNSLKYVGPCEGQNPWCDDEEYYCIWGK